MRLTPRDWEKISGIALIVGPAQFVIETLVEGALIPGYGLVKNWISDLGAPPNDHAHFAPGTELWWAFSVSLIVMAILVFVGLIGLRPLLWRNALGKAVLGLVAIVAIGSIGVAVFNEVFYLPLHAASALTAFGLGWVALVTFGIYIRKQPGWSPAWSILSILGGIASFTALILFAIPTRLGSANSPEWIAAIFPGGSERAIVVPLVLWLIALGARLLWGLPRLDVATGAAAPAAVP